MTTVIVLVVVFVLAGAYMVALGLCWSAAAGDQVQIEPEVFDDLAVLDDDPDRCPACGDPTGLRCCEFGRAA